MDFIVATVIIWGVIFGVLGYGSKLVRFKLGFKTYGACRMFLVVLVASFLSVRALSQGFTDFVVPGQRELTLFSFPGFLIATALGMEPVRTGGPLIGGTSFPLPMLVAIFVANVFVAFLAAVGLDAWLSRRKPTHAAGAEEW